MHTIISVKDKQFKPFISEASILKAVQNVANKINAEMSAKNPVFLVVLNGSFMFASDLLKNIAFPCQISFIKVASYHGTSSSGAVTELIGLTEDLTNKNIVIIEDIVDTGVTLEKLYNVLMKKNVAEIKVATALLKPKSYNKKYPIDFVGIEIENEFVIGYGLDYDGYGRNLKELYIIV
ncbi:MAG: hypoxanthine phosphoribosyltransferase [Bacteroidetes bacterium]|nr:hypoxanthine phosphoribosyltransferase [Bacteroidota bacterium]